MKLSTCAISEANLSVTLEKKLMTSDRSVSCCDWLLPGTSLMFEEWNIPWNLARPEYETVIILSAHADVTDIASYHIWPAVLASLNISNKVIYCFATALFMQLWNIIFFNSNNTTGQHQINWISKCKYTRETGKLV